MSERQPTLADNADLDSSAICLANHSLLRNLHRTDTNEMMEASVDAVLAELRPKLVDRVRGRLKLPPRPA